MPVSYGERALVLLDPLLDDLQVLDLTPEERLPAVFREDALTTRCRRRSSATISSAVGMAVRGWGRVTGTTPIKCIRRRRRAAGRTQLGSCGPFAHSDCLCHNRGCGLCRRSWHDVRLALLAAAFSLAGLTGDVADRGQVHRHVQRQQYVVQSAAMGFAYVLKHTVRSALVRLLTRPLRLGEARSQFQALCWSDSCEHRSSVRRARLFASGPLLFH